MFFCPNLDDNNDSNTLNKNDNYNNINNCNNYINEGINNFNICNYQNLKYLKENISFLYEQKDGKTIIKFYEYKNFHLNFIFNNL